MFLSSMRFNLLWSINLPLFSFTWFMASCTQMRLHSIPLISESNASHAWIILHSSSLFFCFIGKPVPAIFSWCDKTIFIDIGAIQLSSSNAEYPKIVCFLYSKSSAGSALEKFLFLYRVTIKRSPMSCNKHPTAILYFRFSSSYSFLATSTDKSVTMTVCSYKSELRSFISTIRSYGISFISWTISFAIISNSFKDFPSWYKWLYKWHIIRLKPCAIWY